MKDEKVTRRTALKTGAGAIGGMSTIGAMGATSARGIRRAEVRTCTSPLE